MKIRSLCLPLILAMSFLLFWGCKTTENVIAETTQKIMTEPKSLLWEISGNDLTNSSYLFGTIHIIDAEDFFLPEGTMTAMDHASKVVFEIDMADMSDPMKLMPLMQKAFMKGDTTLKDLMSTEDYGIVKAKFSELGLPIFFLEKIKPMFLTVFATGDFNPEDMKTGKAKSYEFEFAEMAENGGKSTGGLETIEFQIEIFDAIPYKAKAEMLFDALRSSDTDGGQFEELITLYKDQDVSGLYKLMQGDQTVESYEDELLVNRNKNWIPQMGEMMSQERTFFAVGAGHLGGANGVLQLLREQGYKVTPFEG